MALVLDDIIHALPIEPALLDLAGLFGNEHAVELEIGTGKGNFLLERAQLHRERNFIGVEWANQYFLHVAQRAAKRGLENVRMLRTDAKVLVMCCLPAAALEVVHIYHPDPWPKKRHHKRRLINAEFAEALVRVVTPGGAIYLQTDHDEYHQVMKNVLGQRTELELTLELTNNPTTAELLTATNYQKKYQQQGRNINRLEYRRKELCS
ncbi:MAG: tRNA (guanine-N(7)-)-methyltransferase [Phycisphaerae bacterium]|nr:tRNA (guanine-N(7)-)-methyltransferase [Phycisphaerae bacterium]